VAKNKMSVDFNGVDKYLAQLKKIDGAAQKAIDSALIATQELIADKAAAAMAPHNQTHVTADQIIRDGDVIWTGDTAEIAVGFKISDENGELPGLPSIFIMYGTETGNQEAITADKALYEAVYGKKTKAEARKLQQEAFDKVLQEVMSG
jgi:hypothetical protein